MNAGSYRSLCFVQTIAPVVIELERGDEFTFAPGRVFLADPHAARAAGLLELVAPAEYVVDADLFVPVSSVADAMRAWWERHGSEQFKTPEPIRYQALSIRRAVKPLPPAKPITLNLGSR